MNLQEEFKRFWKSATGNSGEREFKELIRRYAEPHRTYHNIGHIKEMLTENTTYKQDSIDLNAIGLTIFYHDAIYDTKTTDNEEQSAKLARQQLQDAGAQQSLIDKVSELVLDTKHNRTPQSEEGKAITDIDLAILGKPTSTFDQYCSNIRKEYHWVPEEQYISARIQILNKFLQSDSIYKTQFFQERYETRAKENLQREISILENQIKK